MDRNQALRHEQYYRYAHQHWLDDSLQAEDECLRSVRKATSTVKQCLKQDDSRPATSGQA